VECERHKELNHYLACMQCWYDAEIYPKVIALLTEIVQLESQRDRIGRQTNVSGHFEMLMNNHAKLFEAFGVKPLQPKNAL
jgi:hypothetical protein